jgi:nicotinamide-nucleotide amidase
MVAEVVSIGTELLLGQITDTNAAYLGRTLAGLGIDLYYKTTVGDNERRIVETLARARDRADLILTSGGIGPTEDDLTKECVAQVFGEELVMDEAALETVRAFFSRRGIPMPERNRKQALIYRNGRHIDNPNGTAPGALLEKEGKIVVSLPGPPVELVPMVENHVVPFLTQRLTGRRQYLVTRVFRFVGIGESAVEEEVRDLIRGGNPTLAPLAHTGEVHLRAGAKAATREEAEALIRPVEEELRRRLGRFLYGTDETTLEASVIRDLIDRGLTLAAAESCTGGGLGARLTSVPGSSAAFLGGIVSYSNDAKIRLLGVEPALLERHGAVSAPAAEAMARGARERLGASLAVSITGVAGPEGGTPEKPVGLVFLGLAAGGRVRAERHQFVGLRETVRRRAEGVALQMVREALRERERA